MITGANVEYGDGRVMQCRAIMGSGDMRPFNFAEYYPPHEAYYLATTLSRNILDKILAWRNEGADVPTLPLPNLDRVHSFITGLGMGPYGRLRYIESSNTIRTSGVTDYRTLQSTVVKNNIVQDFGDSVSKKDEDFLNSLRVESVAAHELAHLAGAQDAVFFAINGDDSEPWISHIAISGSKLEGLPGENRGSYIEEGLGTLIASMYGWNTLPGIIKSIPKTKPYKSPKGKMLHVPERSNFIGHHEYAFAGWGLERLIDAAPHTWDIMISSRKYSTSRAAVRAALKGCVDGVQPGLFERIDTTDVNNLDESLETTDRLDYLAKRYSY